MAAESLPAGEDWRSAADTGTALTGERESGSPVALHDAVMPARILQELIDGARDGYPNEACGIIVGAAEADDGGRPTRFYPLRNAADSPYRYMIDPQEQLEVMLELEDSDEVLWGIFHSHVGSPPVPSATDIGLAYYPNALYLICSLAGDVPVVRAWSIRDGAVTEVNLKVA